MTEQMTERELLLGITDALTIAGWRWMHVLRSDGVTMGHSGWPDVVAAHPDRELVLAWELKDDRNQLSPDQVGWLLALAGKCGVDARVIRPADYDGALAVILRGVLPSTVWPASSR